MALRRLAALPLAGLLLVGVPFLLRLALIERRGFNPDEFQHLHSAYSIARGMLPYRDYFDHHTPALHVLLAPLSAWFDVDGPVENAFACIFAARRVMWVVTGLILALTGALGHVWRGRRVAWVAALLLSTVVVFHNKTLEVRPDVPASACLLACWILTFRALRPGGRPAGAWTLSMGGACLGVAVLFTQKALFALPGLVAAALWSLAVRRPGTRVALRETAALVAGFAAPVALTLAVFAWAGGLDGFIRCNFVINASWKGRLGPAGLSRELLRQNPFLVGLAAAGLAAALGRAGDSERRRRGDMLLALQLTGLLGGMLVIPLVYPQYALMFLPLAALLAAAGLVDGVEWVAERSRPGSWPGLAMGALLLLASGLGAAFFAERPTLVPTGLFLALVAAGLLAALGLMRRGAAEAATAVLIVVIAAHGLEQTARSFRRGNTSSLDDLRLVLRNTAPWETTLDGFTGLGVFRPHACYHYVLHGDLQAMLSPEEIAGILEALRSGRSVPKLVFFDRYLRTVSPELTAFLEAHYAPIGREPIRARLFDNGLGIWKDEGVRHIALGPRPRSPLAEPHLLVGDGWRRIEAEGATSFRRSRGGRAELLVPIRNAGPFEVTLHARAQSPGRELELVVNDGSAGRVLLVPGWSDYSFTIDGGLTRAGFNSFHLVGADVALEWISLQHIDP